MNISSCDRLCFLHTAGDTITDNNNNFVVPWYSGNIGACVCSDHFSPVPKLCFVKSGYTNVQTNLRMNSAFPSQLRTGVYLQQSSRHGRAINPHAAEWNICADKLALCLKNVRFVFSGDNTAAIQRQESSVATRWACLLPGLLLPAVCLWVTRWGSQVSKLCHRYSAYLREQVTYLLTTKLLLHTHYRRPTV
jgi:hypothetical protein